MKSQDHPYPSFSARDVGTRLNVYRNLLQSYQEWLAIQSGLIPLAFLSGMRCNFALVTGLGFSHLWFAECWMAITVSLTLGCAGSTCGVSEHFLSNHEAAQMRQQFISTNLVPPIFITPLTYHLTSACFTYLLPCHFHKSIVALPLPVPIL